MSTLENILTRIDGRVGVVQINRPKAMNALNGPTMSEIMSALEAYDADPAVGAMVLTGDERAFAAGAGMSLALACDLRIMSDKAFMMQAFSNIGLIPDAGGTQRLTRAVGKTIAMEMILNARQLTAEEALRYGLVNRVVPTERCLGEAVRLAEEIAVRAPFAIRIAKEAVNAAFETALAEGVSLERRLFSLLFSTDDQKEGMAAFIEKRKAEWKGK